MATFYFDLASPLSYLAAERVLDVLPEPAQWQPVLLSELVPPVEHTVEVGEIVFGVLTGAGRRERHWRLNPGDGQRRLDLRLLDTRALRYLRDRRRPLKLSGELG